MLRLIFAFVDIMLHRRGPESLPSSRFLLWALLATYLAMVFVVDWLAGPMPIWFAVDILVLGLHVWFVWALLRTFARLARFRQTMTALLGAGVLLTVLEAPLAVSLAHQPPPTPQNQTLTLSSLLSLLVVVWAIDIAAFVFSRALERPYLVCAAVVIAYAFLILSLQVTLIRPIA